METGRVQPATRRAALSARREPTLCGVPRLPERAGRGARNVDWKRVYDTARVIVRYAGDAWRRLEDHQRRGAPGPLAKARGAPGGLSATRPRGRAGPLLKG